MPFRRIIALAVSVLLGVVAGSVLVVAIRRDYPQLAWQRFGPTPDSLKETDAGLKVADVRTTELVGGTAKVAIPPHPNGVLVLWFHGYPGDADEIFTQPAAVGMRDQLLDAGYTIASSDGAGSAWGDQASLEAFTAAEQWAAGEVGESTSGSNGAGKVVLIGQSMGGLASLQLASTMPGVVAWVGIEPVCDLGSILDEYTSTIEAAFGGPPPSTLSPIATSGLDVPLLFFASDADTDVPMDQNTDVCAAAAPHATVVEAFGNHGNPSEYQPDTVLEFLARATS